MFSRTVVEIGKAKTGEDFSAASEVLDRTYGAVGYNSGGCQVSSGRQITFVARMGGKIVGTLKVTHGADYLPTDELFPSEMAGVRRQYRPEQFVYLGSFAVLPGFWGKDLQIGHRLMAPAIRWAVCKKGVRAAVIIVNPRDVRKYQTMGFVTIGKARVMPGLSKDPEREILGVLLMVTLQMFLMTFGMNLWRTIRQAFRADDQPEQVLT